MRVAAVLTGYTVHAIELKIKSGMCGCLIDLEGFDRWVEDKVEGKGDSDPSIFRPVTQ
jgi:hypothetical protein